MNKIINVLSKEKRMTATELARKMANSPALVISTLMQLESFGIVTQINGYWSVDGSRKNTVTTTMLTTILKNWGALSVDDISSITGDNSGRIKKILNQCLQKKLVIMNSDGRYHLFSESVI